LAGVGKDNLSVGRNNPDEGKAPASGRGLNNFYYFRSLNRIL